MKRFIELDVKANTEIGGVETTMRDGLLRVVEGSETRSSNWDDHRIRSVLTISFGDDGSCWIRPWSYLPLHELVDERAKF